MRQLKGIAASDGLAIGPAFVYCPQKPAVVTTTVGDTGAEQTRFAAAVSRAREQIATIHEHASGCMDEESAAIFEAHLMFLDDPEFVGKIDETIAAQHINAEAAVELIAAELVATMEAIEDEYLRARAVDVRDVADRLIRNLLGLGEGSLASLSSPVVVVAQDLTPSDTAQMDRSKVLGFCSAAGGTTSHTAILSRALGIAAVVGIGAEIMETLPGQRLLVDGCSGIVEVDPSEQTVAENERKQVELAAARQNAKRAAQDLAHTKDGQRVHVVANIGDVESARSAVDYGAEGVGLLRTEFLYLGRQDMPDEEEQFQAYRAIAEVMGQRPVIVRTLDIGGDKALPYLPLEPEGNPFLGVRAVRLCLEHMDLFETQLRAILRASPSGNLKIMFPMIADIEELRQAKKVVRRVADELRAAGKTVLPTIELGIMVEIPAAALATDVLASEADFFSIGTNDLIQYTMACDRTNEKVAYLYQPLHPAILRLINAVIENAHHSGRPVGMCGEMGGMPEAIPILLGMGLDEFSMNPPAIPRAKEIIRSFTMDEARSVARTALSMTSEAEIAAYARRVLGNLGGGC